MIIIRKKEKKHYDKFGNLIMDPGLVQDLIQGKAVINYLKGKTGSINKKVLFVTDKVGARFSP